MAIKIGGYSYFHFISGNSFIIKSNRDFLEFFEENKGKNFIEIIDSKYNSAVDEWKNYYWFMQIFDYKSRIGHSIMNHILFVEKKIGVRRNLDLPWKGYVYCHLEPNFAQYLIDYIKINKKYLKNLSTVKIPEEFFIPNIVMNSPYRKTIVPQHMVYTDWNTRNGECPISLNVDDLELVESELTNYLFVRKIRDVATVKWIENRFLD